MANKFVIEVRAKGFTSLDQQLKSSDKAMQGFEKSTRRSRRATKGLERGLGSIRNALLLYTFAFAGAIKATLSLVNAASKFETVKTRLVGLTGSVVKANKAFDTFNAVAATTPFTLEDVVNAGAQLKAFGADAEALIKPITNLAAFMGTTATEAANAFGRAYAGGAGAADILRERGILNIIKESQGLTNLATTTLPKFREALITSLQDPAVGIEGSTDRMAATFVGAVSNMQDSITRLMAEVGDRMLPIFKDLTKFVGESAEALRDWLTGGGSDAEEMLKTLKAMGISAENLAGLEMIVFREDAEKQISKIDEQLKKILFKNPQLRKDFEDLGGEMLTIEKRLFGKKLADQLVGIERSTGTTIDLMSVLKQKLNANGIAVGEMAEEFLKTGKFSKELVDSTESESVQIAQMIALLQQEEEIRNRLKDIIAELSATEPPVIVEPKDHQQILKTARAFKQFSDNIGDAIINGQNLGDAVVNSLKAIAAELVAQAASFAILNMITGGGFSASKAGFNLLGAVFPKLGHTGGAVTKNGVQAFANGGVVQGRDNVPILAQAGEFIIRRESAQSIGLDSLRQMNESGQAPSNINVHIHGGVVQEDYIRNELIPAINRSGVRIA